MSAEMPNKNASCLFSHRYQMLSHLGEGGVGNVYRAHDKWVRTDVALKTLSSQTPDPPAVRDLESEFLLMAQLKHPGVVEVFDFGYAESQAQSGTPLPYFTMEYVKGSSLAEACGDLHDDRFSPFDLLKFSRLAWQICDVLEFLHLRGIVHCDLKPQNIKITPRAFGPKILDFGLSEKMASERSPGAKGTLSYMSPEMLQKEPLDQRTDLYSLGVILYEAVTGQLPFHSPDPIKIVSAHLQTKPQAPNELNHQIPSHLNDLILRLLEKSPTERPASAGDVKEMLSVAMDSSSQKKDAVGWWAESTLLAHVNSGPLVARDSELAHIRNHVQEAAAGQGGLLFLSGEQGVGKTALLRQLRTQCQLSGIVYVDAGCLAGQTLAYQPVMEILRKLEPYVESKCPEGLRSDLKEMLSWAKGESLTSEAQASFHKRITSLLTSASRRFPFVIGLEDLHWADLPSLRLLECLRRQVDHSRIFVCCTICEEKLSSTAPAAECLRHSLAGEDSGHLRLERLGAAGAESLIASKFPRNEFKPEFFSWVHDRTSGNPYFVIELLRYLLENKFISLQGSIWVADFEGLVRSKVPDTIESALLKNLKRYDAETVSFLSTLAVIGKRFSLRSLQSLKLLEGRSLSETLSLLIQDQLLVKKEESGEHQVWYEFANQSLQALLYRRLDRKERIDWHRRTAVLLESQTSDADDETIFQIAYHYLEGGMPEKAYRYALLCAERMQQRFANDEALRYLKDAIEVCHLIEDSQRAWQREAQARMKRADFCIKVGELNQAEEDYSAVVRLIKGRKDLKMLVSAYNGLGEVCRLKHEHKKGIAYLKKAMKVHQELNDPLELAHTQSYMGLLYWIDSQYDEALRCFHRALEIDRSLANRFYEANTLNNLGLVYWSRRLYSKALAHFTDALTVYRELENKEWLARTENNIGATLFEMGDFENCTDHFLESYRINHQTKNEREMTFNLENLSEAYRKMGDHSSALDYGLRGLKLATEIDFTDRVGRILKGLGIIHLEMGEYDQSGLYLSKARGVAEDIDDKELKASVLLDMSRLSAILGDAPAASRWFKDAEGIILSLGDEKSQVALYQIKSRLEKEEGRFDRASKFLKDALTLAEKLSLGEEIFSLGLDFAELCLEHGDLSRARQLLEQTERLGLARYRSLEPTFHMIRGSLYRKQDDLSAARKEYQAALGQSEKVGNRELLWKTHHQLGKLLLSLQEIEGAYREFKQAADVLKQLGRGIEDASQRQGYFRETKKKELLSDLKAVAKQLIGEPEPS
jgi:tetratricopeptide (TPR) repeat protein